MRGAFKIGDFVYMTTPISPGKVREILSDYYMVEWLSKNKGITKIPKWRAQSYEQYVMGIEKKYLNYKKKLDKLKNMP